MTKFCKLIGNKSDIWYVGCGEYADYMLTLKSLKILEDSICNPIENKDVWVKMNGELKVIKPGESVACKVANLEQIHSIIQTIR